MLPQVSLKFVYENQGHLTGLTAILQWYVTPRPAIPLSDQYSNPVFVVVVVAVVVVLVVVVIVVFCFCSCCCRCCFLQNSSSKMC